MTFGVELLFYHSTNLARDLSLPLFHPTPLSPSVVPCILEDFLTYSLHHVTNGCSRWECISPSLLFSFCSATRNINHINPYYINITYIPLHPDSLAENINSLPFTIPPIFIICTNPHTHLTYNQYAYFTTLTIFFTYMC
jgi:hypothetical protein